MRFIGLFPSPRAAIGACFDVSPTPPRFNPARLQNPTRRHIVAPRAARAGHGLRMIHAQSNFGWRENPSAAWDFRVMGFREDCEAIVRKPHDMAPK
jgi:hypothetical protein